MYPFGAPAGEVPPLRPAQRPDKPEHRALCRQEAGRDLAVFSTALTRSLPGDIFSFSTVQVESFKKCVICSAEDL